MPERMEQGHLQLLKGEHLAEYVEINSLLGRYCSNADNLMAVGYALLEQLDDNEKTFWKTQTQENRLKMGIMKEEEAKEKIKDTMKKLPPLFQVGTLLH